MAAELQAHFDKTGQWMGDPKLQEPEKTPFPGYAEEIALPLSHLPLSVAPTLEEWAFSLWQGVRRGVSGSGFGPGSITWGDLVAFEQFEGIELTPLMVSFIFAADHAFLSHYKPNGEPK